MMSLQPLTKIYAVLFICLALNILIWAQFRDTQAQWLNVPPVPSAGVAKSFGLGDTQLAYRSIGILLQNLGDSGGKVRSFDDYDYKQLSAWLRLGYQLDPQSIFMPYMAAYYFSAVRQQEKLPPLIKFLEEIGSKPGEQNWRWLVQAVFLARYQLNDNDWALKMAQRLRIMHATGTRMPIWAANMDSMIMSVSGDKEAAYNIMLQTLQTEGDSMEATEKYYILDQICNAILTRYEAQQRPFCEGIVENP